MVNTLSEKPFQLQAPFKATDAQQAVVDALAEGLNEGKKHQTLLGVTGSGKTFVMANLIDQLQRPTLVMAPNKTLAAQLYGELRDFFPNNAVEYFVSYYDYYQPEAYVPSTDTFIQKDASINEQIEQMRLSATKALLERSDVIIVSTVSAIYGLGDPKAYLSMVCHLSVGERLTQESLMQQLVRMQYRRNDVDFARGAYRTRGDVVDVFPADSEHTAIRVSFFDDEIERISSFDPLTGQLKEDFQRKTIFPKTHYVTPREVVLATVDAVKAELKKRLEELNGLNKLVEVQRLAERVRYDIEMMLELGYCQGVENYSVYLSGRERGSPPPTLIDYLPENAMAVFDESHVMVPQLGGMYRGDRSRKETLVEFGFRLPSALDNRPLRFEEFEQLCPQAVYVSATPGDYELKHSGEPIPLVIRPTGLLDPVVELRPAETQVDDLLSEIRERIAVGERVLVTTLTKRLAEDLTTFYSDQGIKVRYLHSDVGTVERVEILRDLRLGVFDVLIGINLLREGLDLPEVSLVAILDADKEGFLRSERSLIQTIGRAARHVNGCAILYADKVTGSMQTAMDAIEKRRVHQQAYNEAHGITPASIKKAVRSMVEPASTASEGEGGDLDPASLTPEQLAKQIKALTKRMKEHAGRLEFEEAASMRDEIDRLKKQVLGA